MAERGGQGCHCVPAGATFFPGRADVRAVHPPGGLWVLSYAASKCKYNFIWLACCAEVANLISLDIRYQQGGSFSTLTTLSTDLSDVDFGSEQAPQQCV